MARGARVIAAILTGQLDDGTAGFAAVRACGGLTIAQDPEDAFAPEMPRNAMRYTPPDYILAANEIGAMLGALAGSPVPESVPPCPAGLIAENHAVLAPESIDKMPDKVAQPSSLTCPECGGTLWRMHEAGPPRYRCHTGHAFSLESLGAATDQVVEGAISEALRVLHEKSAQSKLRAAYHSRLGETVDAERRLSEARRAEASARTLEKLLRGEE
ncbi:CheB methylesterase [Trinickia symbiotica]|uniref:chemotaxis protein CheB n=1 Tax=Trinickia symbiotica TaxID=863227 RepID=UPI000D45BFB5|nr:chemotaxis protein CheB [Trinickia symbiotica]PPK43572.1 CheB methylesterase [Trinickia symbiotica]